MKDSCPKIDALLIDELVSGQLTGERYRATLRALDAEPAKWRDCALAFLEEQALRNDLRTLAQGTINWYEEERPNGSGDYPSLEPSLEDAVPSNSQLSNSQSGIEFSSLHPQHVWNGRFRTVLSTAALLLVSFTVGWLGSEVVAERERSVVSQSNQITQNLEKTPLPVSPKKEPQFVLDDSGAFDRGIPDSIRQLERDGRLTVHTIDMLVPTTMKDGSPAYLPVQQMILGPGSVIDY